MTYRGAALAGAAVPLALALLGLTAWATGALRFASFRADYIPMAPSTAFGFVLVSATLIGRAFDPRDHARNATRAAATLLSLLAVIKLIEFFTGAARLNLEAVLVERPGAFGAVPLARMSPLTAVSFLMVGLALATLAGLPRRMPRDVAGVLGGLVALAGSTVALGYVYGAPILYGGRIIPMALPTGLAFVGTGAALVALTGPSGYPLKPLSGGSASARLLRVFLPLTVVAVLMNGVLTSVILAHSHANPALLAAILALASAAAVGATVSWKARTLGGAIDRAEVVMTQSRDELERRVAERTTELSALNRELESFSYSVSHDLRAPLRHIVGFATLLEKEAGAQLDETSQRRLAQVSAAAARMGRLIDDLLELSRNTRAALQKRTVALADLVREAQAEVAAQTSGREIVWRVQHPLHDVEVDPNLFRLALINLLSNAVKYTAQQTVAQIEVGTTTGPNGETVVFVRDNGVGFDMQYADKLFGVFQRLHSAEEFEGTGIGLANVSRIIQRHGGRTWAEAEVGRGATFFIALPPGLAMGY